MSISVAQSKTKALESVQTLKSLLSDAQSQDTEEAKAILQCILELQKELNMSVDNLQEYANKDEAAELARQKKWLEEEGHWMLAARTGSKGSIGAFSSEEALVKIKKAQACGGFFVSNSFFWKGIRSFMRLPRWKEMNEKEKEEARGTVPRDWEEPAPGKGCKGDKAEPHQKLIVIKKLRRRHLNLTTNSHSSTLHLSVFGGTMP